MKTCNFYGLLLISFSIGIVLTLAILGCFGLLGFQNAHFFDTYKQKSDRDLRLKEEMIDSLNSLLVNVERDLRALQSTIQKYQSVDTALNTSDDFIRHVNKVGEDMEKCKALEKQIQKCTQVDRIHKNFSKTDLENAIVTEGAIKNTMDEAKTADAIAFLHEALFHFINRDGTRRERHAICNSVVHKFMSRYDGRWSCIMGSFQSLVHTYGNGNYIWFDLDQDEAVEIFRAN
uniref:Uncharacterized protein n=1 Tax=Acrobeloides nanus TaxID=290746 RepID=A0A914DW00_9BILA